MNADTQIGSSRSDLSLLRRYRNGDEKAATDLYLRYAARIHAVIQKRCSAKLAQRIDPEDILQSAFRSFFDGANQGHYDGPGDTELWPLLLVIALNKLKKEETRHRTHKRDVERTDRLPPERQMTAVTRPGGDELAREILQMTIDEALEQFPRQYRKMIELRMQGFEVEEIAGMVGCSKRSVERRLQETRTYLKKLLGYRNEE